MPTTRRTRTLQLPQRLLTADIPQGLGLSSRRAQFIITLETTIGIFALSSLHPAVTRARTALTFSHLSFMSSLTPERSRPPRAQPPLAPVSIDESKLFRQPRISV
jgi:hypothetical protein